METNTCIDIHYEDIAGRAAVDGDTIFIEATTTKPVDGYTSRMVYQYNTDDGWSQYIDSSTQVICDFCPVMKIMFGTYPEVIYTTYYIAP